MFPSEAVAQHWAREHSHELTALRAWGLPLVRDGSLLRTAGGGDYPAVLPSPDGPPPDLRLLAGEASALVLHEVSDEHGFLDTVRRHAPAARVQWRYQCPVADFGGDPDGYMREVLSKNRRKKLRRSRRDLDELGTVGHEWVTQDTLPAMFARFFSLICQRAALSGLYDRNVLQRDALERLWRACLGRDLEVSVLTLDGTPISFRSGFVVGDRFLGHLPAFDRDLDHISVGHLHLALLLGELRERGITTYDFGKGARSSKEVWASRRYALSTVVIPLQRSPRAAALRTRERLEEKARATITERGWALPLRRVIQSALLRRDSEYRRVLRRHAPDGRDPAAPPSS